MSSTIFVNGAEIVDATQALTFTTNDIDVPDGAYAIEASSLLTVLGSVTILGVARNDGSSEEAAGIIAKGADAAFHIGRGGSVTLSAGSVPLGLGFSADTYPASFSNDGTFLVLSNFSPTAVALDFGGTFSNTGTITATDFLYGLFSRPLIGLYSGGALHGTNAGSITVSGTGPVEAVDLTGGGDFTNSGAIKAYGSAILAGDQSGGTVTVTNTSTGTIFAAAAVSDTGTGELVLVNSGAINGAISLSSGLGGSITNTGHIAGAVAFSGQTGLEVYDGRGGALSGTLTLGGGSGQVYLGDDGETVYAGAGPIHLLGGAGADTVHGGAGNDVIDGGAGADVLEGGGGINTIGFASATAGVTVSLVLLGTAQDTGAGVKTLINFQNLTGSRFNDRLTGDAHNNVLDGGGGNDILTGGGGADTFLFHPGYGADEVTDFSHAQGDKIDLSAIPTMDSWDVVLANTTQSGPNTVISLPGGGSITLDGVSMASLTVGDFILPPLTHDFAASGVSDVLFRNTSTGDWGYMSVSTSGETWRPIGPSSPGYAAMGVGDFNGDGVLDTAFRNTSTGDWGFLTVNPSGGETWHAVGRSSLAYDAIASGDFNGDGSADVLFRNPTTGDWGYMSVSPAGVQAWHGIGPSSPDYAFMGAGDFNGDGVMDAAFRQVSTGNWGFLSINPSGGETWHAVGPSSLAYTAVAAGDFNADGSSDILFRNPTTGDWGYMSVNASGGESWHPIGPSSPDYAFLSVGDFNGDGVMDAAFRQTSTGQWGYLSIDPGGGETWHYVGPSSTDYMAV